MDGSDLLMSPKTMIHLYIRFLFYSVSFSLVQREFVLSVECGSRMTGLLGVFRTSDHIFDRFFAIFHRFFVDFGLIFWIQVVLKSIKHQCDADLRRSTQLGKCPLLLLRN